MDRRERDASCTLFPLAFFLADSFSDKYNNLALKEKLSKLIIKYPPTSLYKTAMDSYWETDESRIVELFQQLCEYHLEKSITYPKGFPEFEYPVDQAVPWKILVLLRLRSRKGLSNDMIKHPLINPFMPFIDKDITIFVHEEQKPLRKAIFNEFEYKPMS